MFSLDQKIYYACCLILILLCISAWVSSRQPNSGSFADLAALVLIIIVFLTIVLSFIVSHFILKKWYTLSLPLSFLVVQFSLAAWVRNQAQRYRQKKRNLW